MSSSLFENEEFKPYQAAWDTRQRELGRRAGYYDGSIYKKHDLGWFGPRLYKGIKTLYLPLSRAVDVDCGIIPGGWAWAADAPETWEAARKIVFAWSNWDVDGVLYVHYGAQYGISGLRIADLREAKKIVITPVDPTRFLLVPSGQYDAAPKLALYIEQRAGKDGPVEYAEAIEPGRVRTFVGGVPQGVDGRDPDYTNPLGFVPFVEVQHIRTGASLGEATYQKAIPLLDEVNQLASYLADIIAKHAEPQWAAFGAEASEMIKSGDNIWFMPTGTDVKALVAQIDIAGVLSFVQEIAANVKESLPELSFDELRKSNGPIATATVELQLMELTLKVLRCRPNYDHGLADALRMAGKAAKTMKLADLAGLDDEQLAFDPDRPVIPLDPIAAIDLELKQIELDNARKTPTPAPAPPAQPAPPPA